MTELFAPNRSLASGRTRTFIRWMRPRASSARCPGFVPVADYEVQVFGLAKGQVLLRFLPRAKHD